MKPEHDEVIEAMARRYMKYTLDSALDQYEETFKESIKEGIKDMVEAAAERGWVLARLPEEKEPEGGAMDRMEYYAEGCVEGWNACLDAIETIELDKEQDNG